MSGAVSSNVPLNPEQEAAVYHDGGPLLVLAPAGSGKTRVVIERLLVMISRSGKGGERFFVATFTRKAAGELIDRISKKLPGTNLPWVGTFHSLSARLLRQFADPAGLSSNFTIFDAGDQKSLVREIMKRHRISEEDLNPQEALRQISRWKNARQKPTPDLARRLFGTNRWLSTCYEEYERGLVENRALDYDDLLFRLVGLLETRIDVAQQLRDQFHHILVDEYQDTNPLQEELIRLVSRNRSNVTVVGDDDQSIYQFRGADISHIRSFGDHYPGARKVLLCRNYRSTLSIVSAASSVISRNGKRYEKEVEAVQKTGSPLTLKEFYSEEEEASYVSRRVKEWVERGGRYGDSAVLFRTHAQALSFEKSLSLAGIPFFRKGGGGFFEGREVKDLLAYLRVMANPFDRVGLTRLLNVPPRGMGDKALDTLVALISASPESHASDLLEQLSSELRRSEKLSGLAGLLREGSAMGREGASPATILEEVLGRTGYREWVAESSQDPDQAERRIGAISEFRRVAEEFSPDPEDKRFPLLIFLEDLALAHQEMGGKEEAGRVSLMTIHQSKGLEFDQVFVVGLEDQILPLRGKTPTDIEEERRLLYVAMTRARQRLHLTWCQTRRLYGRTLSNSPSPFLRDIPESLFEGDRPKSRRIPSHLEGRPRKDQSSSSVIVGGIPSKERSPLRAFRGEASPMPRTPHRSSGMGPRSVQEETPRSRRTEWIGRKVRHPRFGDGEVVDAFSPDPDLEVVIRFSDGILRTLLARVANLTMIEGKNA